MTIEQHLRKGLCQSAADQAIQNTEEAQRNDPAKNLNEALGLAFPWQKSPEGFEYWYAVFQELLNNEN